MYNADGFASLHVNKSFGYDGAGGPAELRPAPSACAATVVYRLQNLIVNSEPARALQEYEWICGNGTPRHPIGGHIHIGAYGASNKQDKAPVITPSAKLSTLLSHLLVPFAIALSTPEGLRIRLSTTYGALDDIRHQPHGLEWRTLPSWLFSPWIAYFFLEGAKLIALEYVNAQYTTTELDGLLPLSLIYSALSTSKLKAAVLKKLDAVAESLRELDGWEDVPQLDKALNKVLDLVSKDITWDGVDFKSNWNTSDLPIISMSPRTNVYAVVDNSTEYLLNSAVESWVVV